MSDGYIVQGKTRQGLWDDLDGGYTDLGEAFEAMAREAQDDPDTELRVVLHVDKETMP